MNYTTVACRLPQGLVLTIPGYSVTLSGTHSRGAVVVASKDGIPAALTKIESDLWEKWKAMVTPYYPPLRQNAVFEYGKDGKSQLEDAVQQKTGLEGFDPSNPPDELKVNPADNTEFKDEVKKSNSNNVTNRPVEEKDVVNPASSSEIAAAAPVETEKDNAYLQAQYAKEEHEAAMKASKAISGK